MKMEIIYSSERLIDFQQTTQRYIPEDRTLHNHCCEKLGFYRVIIIIILLLFNKIIIIIIINLYVCFLLWINVFFLQCLTLINL
jgi:hypothetical protein